jgi:hypothetical protein
MKFQEEVKHVMKELIFGDKKKQRRNPIEKLHPNIVADYL